MIVIGDSNTQFGYENGRWLSLLSDKLVRICDVINRGFSGYNTRYIKVVLPYLTKQIKADDICGVIILLGTNDSSFASYHFTPVEKYVENLKWIIDYLIKFGIDKNKIILISPPRIDDDVLGAYLISLNYTQNDQTYFDNTVKNYAQKCIEVAIKKNVKYLDLYSIMKFSNESLTNLLYDGLHLSERGGRLLFSYLWPIVESEIVKNGKLEINYPNSLQELVELENQSMPEHKINLSIN